MALEQDLRTFLKSKLSFNDNQVFYQHLDRKPTSPFIWFIRNGDDYADSLDDLDGDEPFTVYLMSSSIAIPLRHSNRWLQRFAGKATTPAPWARLRSRHRSKRPEGRLRAAGASRDASRVFGLVSASRSAATPKKSDTAGPQFRILSCFDGTNSLTTEAQPK